MNYDVLIERNVLKEIKKFPEHDVNKIKKGTKKTSCFPGGYGRQKDSWNKKHLPGQGWELQDFNRT